MDWQLQYIHILYNGCNKQLLHEQTDGNSYKFNPEYPF